MPRSRRSARRTRAAAPRARGKGCTVCREAPAPQLAAAGPAVSRPGISRLPHHGWDPGSRGGPQERPASVSTALAAHPSRHARRRLSAQWRNRLPHGRAPDRGHASPQDSTCGLTGPIGRPRRAVGGPAPRARVKVEDSAQKSGGVFPVVPRKEIKKKRERRRKREEKEKKRREKEETGREKS